MATALSIYLILANEVISLYNNWYYLTDTAWGLFTRAQWTVVGIIAKKTIKRECSFSSDALVTVVVVTA